MNSGPNSRAGARPDDRRRAAPPGQPRRAGGGTANLRADHDHTLADNTANEIGDITLLATITAHEQGLDTPALYGMEVTSIQRHH
ncbi:hypothetical protein GCM10020367_71130 [Streptomyces sannanensis]|uniref:Uncharacterized protein n=1 Tax=Streptomyces sannanensis TaxID=285536 RepID=A0ABP6SP69_9ACTN